MFPGYFCCTTSLLAVFALQIRARAIVDCVRLCIICLFLRLRGALVAIHRYAIAWAEGDTHTRARTEACWDLSAGDSPAWRSIPCSCACSVEFVFPPPLLVASLTSSLFFYLLLSAYTAFFWTREARSPLSLHFRHSCWALGAGHSLQTGDPYPLALHPRTPHISSSCCHHHSACCLADKTTRPVQISLSIFFQRDLRPR